MPDPTSIAAALDLLRALGAPSCLLTHGTLVADAAAAISTVLRGVDVPHDENFVLVGAVIHDAGKITHPEEMVGPGSRHEAAGEQLLLQHKISSRLARVCRTHGQWSTADATLDDRVIALADHLWKGTRGEEIERLVIRDAASQLGAEYWDIFMKLDPAFEAIAAGGEARLALAKTDR